MKANNFKEQYSSSSSVVQRELFGVESKILPNIPEQSLKKGHRVYRIIVPFLILFSILILLLPLLPGLFFNTPDIVDVEYQEQRMLVSNGEDNEEEIIQFEENRLIIPAVGINVEIVEGEDESALSEGVWRRPASGTPDEGGNTVITGHRFYYLPPNNMTFYNLDKLDIGRKVFVYWEGERYVYKVYDSFIVDDTRVDIEEDLGGNILTLYTCHPLWTADKRFVIRAELESDL